MTKKFSANRKNSTQNQLQNKLEDAIKLHQKGEYIEAEVIYKELLNRQSNHVQVLYLLGTLYAQCKKYSEAIELITKVIALKPKFAEAYNNRGNVFNEIGLNEKALSDYRQAIQFNPNYAEAFYNQGVVLYELQLFEQSISCYESAIRLRPSYSEAYNNRGVVLDELNQPVRALASYQKAIEINPNYGEVLNNRGNLLKDLSMFDEALKSYDLAIKNSPHRLEVRSNRLLALNYCNATKINKNLIEAREYGEIASALAKEKYLSWNLDLKDNRLVIGFVSGDLRNHPIGYFLEGLITRINRNQFKVIVFSSSNKEDSLTEKIKGNVDEWVSIYKKSDLDAASLIHKHDIQILYDLSGHTAKNRLPVFSYKPAPIQVTWLGYFATTGLLEVDYILGDPFVTPLSESHHFVEKIWQLPETYLCFTPPNELISITPLPALDNGFITFGCFNNLAKISDGVIRAWALILKRVPNSKLLLKTKQFNDPKIVEFVLQKFESLGVNRACLIIESFSPRIDLLRTYGRVDVALDPFPFPGGTTSVEALWMGVPVITLKGDCFLSHVGESIMHNAGLSQWIAQDLDEYVVLAEKLTAKLHDLSELRNKLREVVINSPLFNADRFSKNFEVAAFEMWKVYVERVGRNENNIIRTSSRNN